MTVAIRKQGGDHVILDRIANGERMNAIGADYDVSRQYIYSWIHAGGPDREKAWREAKRWSADALVDDGLVRS